MKVMKTFWGVLRRDGKLYTSEGTLTVLMENPKYNQYGFFLVRKYRGTTYLVVRYIKG